ncbi:MAG: NTP transferase domain-containing protein [bacterium]|nr:NTP transferase domain-containing protein [bacterium]
MKACFFNPADDGGAGDANCAALILAAGKGTRMKSDLPKVLHELCGRTLVMRVVEASRAAGLGPMILVLGHRAELVRERLSGEGDDLRFALQEPQNGTGHAVQMARPQLEDLTGDILVLAGDVPLIRAETLADLLALHREKGAAATVLTAELTDPTGYGRMIRDTEGNVAAIREHRDASAEEKLIREINSGIYCFRLPELLEALAELRPDNDQGELYLTDTLAILRGKGEVIAAYLCDDEVEIAGINDTEQLAAMEVALLEREE